MSQLCAPALKSTACISISRDAVARRDTTEADTLGDAVGDAVFVMVGDTVSEGVMLSEEDCVAPEEMLLDVEGVCDAVMDSEAEPVALLVAVGVGVALGLYHR